MFLGFMFCVRVAYARIFNRPKNSEWKVIDVVVQYPLAKTEPVAEATMKLSHNGVVGVARPIPA